MNSNYNKILYAVLRSALWQQPLDAALFQNFSGDDWINLFILSTKQGATALAWSAIDTLPENMQPPKKSKLSWALSTQKIESKYAQKLEVVDDLSNLYSSHNIQMMIIKGIGVCSYYPLPQRRECGDIDIYLYGKQKEADKLVEDNFKIKVKTDVHRHTVFAYKGVTIENHYAFLDSSHKSNVKLEKTLKRLVNTETGELIKTKNAQYYIPSANFNAVYLLRHMAAHFAAQEIVIRHVCDWMMFLKNESTKINFDSLLKIVNEQNMNKFFDAVNTICIKYLGMDKNLVPQYTPDYELTDKVLNEILSELVKPKSHKFTDILVYKINRFRSNIWKYKIVYKDNIFLTFLRLAFTHITKPKTILYVEKYNKTL